MTRQDRGHSPPRKKNQRVTYQIGEAFQGRKLTDRFVISDYGGGQRSLRIDRDSFAKALIRGIQPFEERNVPRLTSSVETQIDGHWVAEG